MWGVDDYNSWLSTGTPCILDRYLNPKKAFNAVFNPEKYNEKIQKYEFLSIGGI
jgi:GH35 family endo-1,4-beta-xylanase